MVISGSVIVSFGMKMLTGIFAGAGKRWLTALANPRTIAALGMVWVIAMNVGERKGVEAATAVCDAKSKEAIAAAIDAVHKRNEAAQEVANAEQDQGEQEIATLKSQLDKKEQELRDALSKAPSTSTENPSDCGWSNDELNRLRGGSKNLRR